MPTLAVICPVLGRPQRVRPLADSLNASIETELADGWEVELVFVCSSDDKDERLAVTSAGFDPLVVGVMADSHQWGTKVNRGIDVVDADWYLLAADDLRFHPGWLTAAIRTHEETGAMVIGTNDLGNALVKAGRHSTHPLVHHDYLAFGTIDEPGKLIHQGYHHNSCNPPEARVWMADLSFKNLGDIEVGDEIMGWHRPARDEFSRDEIDDLLASLCGTRVLAVGSRTAPLIRVCMASGREFRCTPDHLWFNGYWSPSARYDKEWITATVGRSLLHVIDEPRRLNRDEAWLAGWLGGIYDGEGSGVYAATQSIFRNPEVAQAITDRLTTLGIPHSTPDGTWPGVKHFSLLGGRQTFLNFLTWCTPVKTWRLEAKIMGSARFGTKDKIAAIEPAASGEVISMTTESGNYIVWGYASKNCDVEFCETAMMRRQWAFAANARIEHLHPLWHRDVRRDWVYAKGSRNSIEDRDLLNRRRHLWRAVPDPPRPHPRRPLRLRR